MKTSTVINLIETLAPVLTRAKPSLFSNHDQDLSSIPSSQESAVMGRRILALSKLATLSTVFPASESHDDAASALERRPADVQGAPIGLMDYVADCEDRGEPTIVAIKIATTFKNAAAGSNVTLSMRWIPPYPPRRRMSLLERFSQHVQQRLVGWDRSTPDADTTATTTSVTSPSEVPDPVAYSAANLPRFSLLGYLESVDPDPSHRSHLESCFVRKHPDAKYWLPGNTAVHESEWMRLVVTQVYWIGGFGDRAYIGWIPLEEWRNVTREEWGGIELPGEKKGWSEWAVDGNAEL